MNEEIKIGDYIIIQKQNFKKLHKLNKPNTSVTLGRDSVSLSGLEGCKYFSLFRMIPANKKKNREYSIEEAQEIVHLKDEILTKVSGADNRNIIDDGRSQKLTAAEIEDLKNDSSKASDIVETLITNSNTFHNKTEYSQEKYLKKKEKKYFEYLQILRPNLRMIADIMYKLDPSKIQGLRIDTLSQIITQANINSEGNYLLYDSGSNGLMASAILGSIGAETNGKLIHMHPGNMSQKQALLAMNFSEEQYCRCISVNIYSVLRQMYQGCDTHSVESCENDKNKSEVINTENNGTETIKSKSEIVDNDSNTLKRKASDDEGNKSKMQKLETSDLQQDENTHENKQSEPKKPKWHFDNIAAADLLKEKVDALVIACKEDPTNIVTELLEFVKPGRPFVIYYSVVEPLQQLYCTLKSKHNVAALKITCNWMRNYQVLPERTHPEVTMNAASGYLLCGYVLK